MRQGKHHIGLQKIAFLFCSAALLMGCGDVATSEATVKFPEKLEQVESQTIASNEKLTLEWDSEKKCILIKQHGSEKVWSTIPYELYLGEEVNEELNAPIYIEYVNSTNLIKEKLGGYNGAVAGNRVSSTKIEDGIELIYYFDSVGISVPVQYQLTEEALDITVDMARVQEGKENKLLSVSVAPYLCSTVNNTEDSYLVVPSGSGALMYVDEREEGTRTWSGDIYGEDLARLLPESLNQDETVRLPFFGVKQGSDALLTIVKDGQEAATLSANAGNQSTGYSNAQVTFYARGYDVAENSKGVRMTMDIYQLAENIVQKKVTASFYPMNGEDADYVGMAKRYQEYLNREGILTQDTKEEAYALYLSGGGRIQELFVGLPFETTKALTTFEQAEDILEELLDETGISPEVQLKGFGKTGLDAGKVAGGFAFADAFGDENDRKSLEEFCKENEISLFTDFDLIHFKKNGNGYFTLIDTAGSALMRKVKIYPKHKALWSYEKKEEADFLLKRERLQSAVDELEKVINKKKLSGVSLSTLGQYAYSDYSKEEYNLRGGSITDVQKFMKQISNAGSNIATNGANIYAAVMADSVFEVPIGNGDYTGLDATVPLYQLVLRGYASLYSTAINLEADQDAAIANAVSSGTSLGFSLVGEYDLVFTNTYHKDLFASDYEGNKESLVETVSKTAEYYSSIQGESIINYEFISDTVTKTEFHNGVTVYVNHSDRTVPSPVGELKAYEFSYVMEGM